MINDRDMVKEKVLNLFEERFQVNTKHYKEGFCDEELLGKYMRLNGRDLVYLFFDVEKNFDITIPQEDLINGSFNTLNHIIDIICKQLLLKSA
jgi:acyl carrier protein